jgi:nicotinamidase/pyrazinamidase
MTGIIVVDIQGDFTQLMNGSLAVPGTHLDYIHKIGREINRLKESGYPLWASQDWHPPDHISFFTNHPGRKPFETMSIGAKEQVLWPPHCVQGTPGAELLIETAGLEAVVQKGQNSRHDSYSAFQDDGGLETELNRLLKGRGIKKLVIFGIATDYCVRFTARDGFDRGYQMVVVESLCRGIDPRTTAEALGEIRSRGGVILENTDSLL